MADKPREEELAERVRSLEAILGLSATKIPRNKLRPHNAYGRLTSLGASPDFLTPERVALIRQISDDMSRNPAILALMETQLRDYADEIQRVLPTDEELKAIGLQGVGPGGEVAIAPVAAAAAVAPGALALAAGPAVFVN